tara:strand:- start:488 stop:766 length:279 start_codon:yes stop_codon:yes gene_type:complete
MTNPYTILGVSQNSNKTEILKSQMFAMKKKEFPLQEIALAAKQLLYPSKRLAADFMFPAKIKVKRIKPIRSDLRHKKINIDALNENAFNSLK